MIESVSISNYALIDKTELELEKGFSVITGETGAGKSILLGAVGLTLGQRADTSALMDKERKCIVEIVYQIKGYALKEWFDRNELDYSDSVTVRREITPEGKSRGFINDTPVNNKLLKELGSFIIDIHSQHQSLLLGQPEYQVDMLDAFCGNLEVLNVYREKYMLRRNRIAELNRIREEEKNAAKEQDYLKFQLAQLEKAQLKEGEKEELEEELGMLNNAESIKSVFTRLTYELRDRDQAMVSMLKNLKNSVCTLVDVVKDSRDYGNRLESVILELKDLADEAERKAERIEYDPQRIATVNERLSVIYELTYKYKVETVKELLQIKEDTAHKLYGIEGFAEQIKTIEKEIRQLEEDMTDLAGKIHRARVKGGQELCHSMKELLTELGIKHAEFVVSVDPLNEYMPTGTDDVKFLFAANKNQVPGEIFKVASGGEISRVMLSLKYILSKTKQLPVIVFDEIDTGLSGEVAHKMALMMKEMSARMQVISISHLPQIAAAGDCHFKVYKEDDTHHTISRIRRLTSDERIREIAAMISGSEITPAALETAKLLLTSN